MTHERIFPNRVPLMDVAFSSDGALVMATFREAKRWRIVDAIDLAD